MESFADMFQSPKNILVKSQINIWDKRFFELSQTLASWSEDESRKVGCVVVGDGNEVRSTGYNGLPRGIKNTQNRNSKQAGEKYYWFEHAERNAIYNAVRAGTQLENCRMYVTLFPCADCTRAIIQSGIIQLNSFPPPSSEEFFGRSFDVAIEMLNEANIELRLFEHDLLRKL